VSEISFYVYFGAEDWSYSDKLLIFTKDEGTPKLTVKPSFTSDAAGVDGCLKQLVVLILDPTDCEIRIQTVFEKNRAWSLSNVQASYIYCPENSEVDDSATNKPSCKCKSGYFKEESFIAAFVCAPCPEYCETCTGISFESCIFKADYSKDKCKKIYSEKKK
jgi:hypothetical protein